MIICKLGCKNRGHITIFIENENEVFLKTIIPSRKATKQYLHGGNDND